MVEEIKNNPITSAIDCACVIHGSAYSWTYVEKLYSMLNRHSSHDIKLHVYTEKHRPVPAPMIKHELIDWGISGPKKSWWYKMQLFNSEHHSGPLLYFDLDTVIVGNIDWIQGLPLHAFWALRDFKYLWRPTHQGINSSLMYWNTAKYDYVWQNFKQQNLNNIINKYVGDQDYISQAIDSNQRQFIDENRVKSWRWQCLDGGYNFKRKTYQNLGAGTHIENNTSLVIFHGKPKPDQITDPVIIKHWQ